MQKAHDVILTDPMSGEENAEQPVLLGDPPGGLLNLRRGLDPLELIAGLELKLELEMSTEVQMEEATLTFYRIKPCGTGSDILEELGVLLEVEGDKLMSQRDYCDSHNNESDI
ncbi:hypothetical protein G7Z17_g8448 [Cylindrodendrum hubeiense]|uniref:Uncharacterized protein n=1 Tax=Cylindrodendrum hubeiense TaxID=595255 RepID=A0A9P5H704_9HYPO|nr:hypothetical protein G7Z17_g8448 [Cylindrodendrum hubeiense]